MLYLQEIGEPLLWRAANVGPKWLSHYFKSEKQTNTILMASFFRKHVESWMGMMVLGGDCCGLWANRPSWNTCIPAKQTCRKVLLETCWRPLQLITEIEFLFTTPTKQYMNARIPASSPKQLGRWQRWFDWVAIFLPITFVCLRWLFTLYHGRSPLDHHLGEYYLLYSKHLKQIQDQQQYLALEAGDVLCKDQRRMLFQSQRYWFIFSYYNTLVS